MADPIDVQAPDGSIVRFPAGTSDATINAAMSKEFGKAKPTLAAPAAPSRSQREGGSVPPFGEEPDLAALARQSGPAPDMSYHDQMAHVLGAADNTVRAVANGIKSLSHEPRESDPVAGPHDDA